MPGRGRFIAPTSDLSDERSDEAAPTGHYWFSRKNPTRTSAY